MTSGAASTRSTIPVIRTAVPRSWRHFETLANVATKAGVEGAGIRIHAPLMRMSKSDIAREGQRLGIDFSVTVSCYKADSEGRACGHCDACRLRAQGFREAGLPDPTRYV
jgi:7-cyano-7-deazaguanine synthase